ncbi:ATP-binding protein [Lysinibacillus sp. CNPSo 3705]|uniref:sensor histidine kinase n=1 Tax=Lysinibacillus sp. CNPSo 3705 TaxID=3028148 RepID=UPI002363E70C|nr:ATP-binding protein [Lysinibacillus sp. CNPSo 3705]MDD1503538.1 ATP-binding protein [Lysinibacillus sp. CNPSo 3705]
MSKWTYSIFITYLLLGIYVLIVAMRIPLLGILVDTTSQKPVITEFYYPTWAQQNNIEKGDMLLTIDGIPAENIRSIQLDSIVRGAKELTFMKTNGEFHSVKAKHKDNPEEFYLQIIFPLFYFVLSLGVAIYLLQKNKENQLTSLLTLFLLTCSLTYISCGASSRGNLIGEAVISIGIVLCILLFIHFLQFYFRYLHLEWPYLNTKWLYLLLLIIPCCNFIMRMNSDFRVITALIYLTIFAVLVLYAIYILLTSYLRTKLAKIRLITIAFITPFLPFLLLFVIPEILGQNPILHAEVAALFLLFIPFSFIFIQVNERLFDIEYQLSRLRYYSTLAFFSALILTTGITILVIDTLSIIQITSVFILIFLIIIASFYIKEQLDFKYRKIIFSSTGNYVHNLYAAVNRMGKAKDQQELLEQFKYEITEKLGTTAFTITTITEDTPFSRGEVNLVDNMTHLLLHDSGEEKIMLTIRHALQKEELLWLELLALYVSMFIDNLKLIEDLISEIRLMKDSNDTQLPWLDKLLWNIIEKEKSILAQELHDTILQEQLHLGRELDVIASAPIINKEKVLDIREQLLNASKDLREYCENLSPPLLDTFGLQIALKKLIQKVKIRADFLLNAQIERVQFQDATLHLVVYRLVQELLNNAIKHAEATEVSLKLQVIDRGFTLQYEDNGIGCDIEDLMQSSASMGINGIRERVRAFNGDITITSSQNEGMQIFIQIQEDVESYD